MNYFGGDPGLKGAFALIHGETGALLGLWPMPVVATGKGARKVIDTAGVFELLGEHAVNAVPVIEKVGGMPKQSAPSAFNFGRGFEAILTGLHALRTLSLDHDPVLTHYPAAHLVIPQTWKKKILAGTDKSKGAAIIAAKRIFPAAELVLPRCTVPHDGLAEALLLAEYGRQCRLL